MLGFSNCLRYAGATFRCLGVCSGIGVRARVSLRDFQAFAKQTGNALVEQQTVGDEFVHVLKRR